MSVEHDCFLVNATLGTGTQTSAFPEGTYVSVTESPRGHSQHFSEVETQCQLYLYLFFLQPTSHLRFLPNLSLPCTQYKPLVPGSPYPAANPLG